MPGAAVIVPRLGRAEVVGLLPDDKVEVRIGSMMRTTVPIAQVLIDTHRAARRFRRDEATEPAQQAPQAQVHAPAGNGATAAGATPAGARAGARTLDTTVDVRGNRVDEAVTQVERFLDESLLANRDTVFIIHGHGSGALRSAVRTHLQAHRAISTFRPGEQNEGGDGVTVAFLK